MSPRFVDMNADGFSDIVVGGHDGIAQVVYGSADGFEEAALIPDREGGLVSLSKYYDWEKKEGEKTGWRYKVEGSKAHGTSVNPVDWDGDGDFDLLIGDSAKGGLYVQINEGTAKAPEFAADSVAVQAGGKPVKIEMYVSDSLIVDWNQDDLFDIVLGGVGGGVYLLENTGDAKEPKFAAVKTLIEPVDKRAKGKRLAAVKTFNNLPAEPGSSLHLEATDYDNDGKLDLLIGSRCSWKMDKVDGMTEADKEKVVKLSARVDELSDQAGQLYLKVKETDEPDLKKELSQQARELTQKMRIIDRKRRNLTRKDKPQRHGDYVWLLRGK